MVAKTFREMTPDTAPALTRLVPTQAPTGSSEPTSSTLSQFFAMLPTVAIAKGGTGQVTAAAGHDALTVKAADVGSAGTVDLGLIAGLFVHITGTTTIASFGATAAAGVVRIVRFASALVLTYHATSMILPTAASITTAGNDIAIMVCEGGGNWRCAIYQRASGAPLVGGGGLSSPVALVDGGTGQTTAYAGHDALTVKAADLASAATTSIGAALGLYVTITGVTGITSFGAATAGVVRIVRFSGILTLTHHATNLILPTAANITTAVGDTAVMVCEATGAWRCIVFQRASGLTLGADLSIDATSAANGYILKRVAGAPAWAGDQGGFQVGVSAPAGSFLATTGSHTFFAGAEPVTLSSVRMISVGGTASVQLFEGGTAINGFASPVSVTTTAADTASTEAIAAKATMRIDWTGAQATATCIAVSGYGLKT